MIHYENSVNNCPNCQLENPTLKSCENCSDQSCSSCLIPKHISSHADGPSEYQVCQKCSLKLTQIASFISSESLSWGHLSSIGSNWLFYSGAKNWANSQKLSIGVYSNLTISSSDISTINKDVLLGRTDPSTFNWELRETIARLDCPNYREDISTVLKSFCARNRKVGYCQGMNVITAWLLIFLDIEGAFILLCYLIEKSLPKDFYVGSSHGNALNGFYVESTVIAAILEHIYPQITKQQMSTNDFTDFFALQHLIQLFINTVDFQSTLYLWNKLAVEGSISLIKGIVSLIIISEDSILNDTHPLMIIKSLQEKKVIFQLEETFSKINSEITQDRVDRLRDKARNYRSKEWMDCKNIVSKKIENISGFTPEEIQELQVNFNAMVKKITKIEPERKTVTRRRSSVELPVEIQSKMDDYLNSQIFGIKKIEFINLLNDINPVLGINGEIIFDTFNEGEADYLDFRELVLAISSICKGNFEEKLQICFNAYDSEKCGFLDSVEIQFLIQRILEPYSLAAQKNPMEKEIVEKIVGIHQKMMNLSEKVNGRLSYFDLLQGIKADSFLWNCFNEFFGIEFSAQYSKIYTSLNIRSMSEVKINSEHNEKFKCSMCLLL